MVPRNTTAAAILEGAYLMQVGLEHVLYDTLSEGKNRQCQYSRDKLWTLC